MPDVPHSRTDRRTLLQSARLRFGREKLRAKTHGPAAAYATRRGIDRIHARRADGRVVGMERIPWVAVINMRERSDRLSSFMEEMRKLGIEEVRRFEAIPDERGPLGCARSHASLVRQMVETASTCLMICEDDVRFRASRDELDVLVDAFLDDDRAEVACLEFNAQKTRRYSRLFLRAVESQNAGCYLVKATIAEDLLDAFEAGVAAMAAGGDPLLHSVDIVWKELQRSRIFVVPIERAAYQEPGYSNVEERYVSRI